MNISEQSLLFVSTNPQMELEVKMESVSCAMQRPTEKKRTSKRKAAGGVKLSTDPQSVAARERRHRISERFKILQSMVPGGTKMDTVSMLEEAIHYVKFLKTQIWLHQAAAAAAAAASSPSAPAPSSSVLQLPATQMQVNDDVCCCSSFASYNQLHPSQLPSSSEHAFYVKVEREEQQLPFYI